MLRGLKALYREVLDTVGPQLRITKAKAPTDVPTTRAQDALREVKGAGLTTLLAPTRELLQEVAQAGADEALVKLGIEGPFSELPDPDVVDYALERSALLIGVREGADGTLTPNPGYSITEATRDELQTLIGRAFEEGWSLSELRDNIAETGTFSMQRAQLIARTEVAGALVQGNVAGWKRSGVVTGKRWLLGSEHDIDDECDDNEQDDVIGIDDAFSSGDDAPPAHPNCVCDLEPITESDEGDDTEGEGEEE